MPATYPGRARPLQFAVKDGPEIVLGLVAPIGTDLALVQEVLRSALHSVGYQTEPIRVSSLLQAYRLPNTLVEQPLEERYRSYMDAGNYVRREMKAADALARLAIAAVGRVRFSKTQKRKAPLPRTAFILNQLKRPEEAELLRNVYGPSFFLISAFASESTRLENLTTAIADSHHGAWSRDSCRSKAQELISRDSEEEDQTYGQRVRHAFPMADVIISANSRSDVEYSLQRFVRVIFGDPFIAPTRDEYFMFLAKAASLRSTDLSRQVGAVLTTQCGDLVATGFNEVPKAGGGVYEEEDRYNDKDHRDFVLGYDSNYSFKKRLLADLLRRLKEWFRDDIASESVDALLEKALAGKENQNIATSTLMDLLEFGRVIHAEMNAIIAARRGATDMCQSILYSTTFPCHMCARHIIATGISRVVYLEPYSKSLAAELYPDSIIVEGKKQRDTASVSFETFVGVAPARFLELFARGRRKHKDGKAAEWRSDGAVPIVKAHFPSSQLQESWVIHELEEMTKESKIDISE